MILLQCFSFKYERNFNSIFLLTLFLPNRDISIILHVGTGNMIC